MRSVVVYESMYGNTRTVAEHVAEGLAGSGDVAVVPVQEATCDVVAAADLLVVGGPTHVHGMSSATSRSSAHEVAAKVDSPLSLDPAADGPGLRDWLETLVVARGTRAAAFDTRVDVPVMLSGHASSGIARRLAKHGCTLVTGPQSFLVDKSTVLLAGETDRAERWGRRLAEQLVTL